MKLKQISLLILTAFFFSSCLNNAFLDRAPKTELIESTLFTTDDNFRLYAWSFYEIFPAYSLKNLYGPGLDADDFFAPTAGKESSWAWQKVKVPSSSTDWDFSFIRKVNLMLDNIGEASELSEKQKKHWRSIGLFFRAYRYSEMLSKFGDVPWINHCLDVHSEELFLPRDSREAVADSVLANLLFAEKNLLSGVDGGNSVTSDVVRAFISRFCLFEGTWRKYHSLSGGEKFLKECVRASKDLADAYPQLHPNYDELFNSVDLKGTPGVLLYRQYVRGLEIHNVTTAHKGDKMDYELSKDLVDSYLCENGKPIYEQRDFPKVEKNAYTEFANRDRRLYYCVLPPYKISTENDAFVKDWWHTDNPMDRTFFSVMESISEEGYKLLPLRQKSGSVCKHSPHFKLHNGGFAFQATQGGYYPIKYIHRHDPEPTDGSETDAPIFRMGEVLLNYAEAAYELGLFDQEVADLTINKLRERGHVVVLDIDNIPEDRKRDQTVSALLWEIRRERRIELMAEGFRLDDLRRWKKGEYVNKKKLGRWHSAKQLVEDGLIPKASNCKIKFQGGGNEGYITFEKDPIESGYGWLKHYYLYPLPLNDLALNKQLKQNPGWE